MFIQINHHEEKGSQEGEKKINTANHRGALSPPLCRWYDLSLTNGYHAPFVTLVSRQGIAFVFKYEEATTKNHAEPRGRGIS